MTRLCCLSKILIFILLFSIIFVATAFSLSPPPKPNVTFDANPTTITMGESSTLTWTSDGDSTTIDGTAVSLSGSMPANPTSTKTYNLSSTASNNNGTSDPANAAVTITVQYSITATAGLNGSISPSGTSIFNSGDNQTYTFTPNAGYRVADVTVDGASQGATNSYSFTGISTNHSISVSFELITYTISASAASNGTISPSGASIVNQGTNLSFTITPNTGYHVLDVLVDGSSVGPVGSYNFTNISADHTISATFAIDTYNINSSADTGGSVSPAGVNNVNHGDVITVTITPAAGYVIADVQVDGSSAGAVSSYTFSNVTANHTIHATFVATYSITASADAGGMISPNGVSSVTQGSNLSISITPDTGYSISDVLVDGISVGAVAGYDFTNVTVNHTIHATFAINTFTITPTSGANGTISPDIPTSVNYDGSLTVDIVPNSGYSIADVLVDGVSVGVVSPHTFSNVTADHSIHADFTINTYTITASADPGGSITPNGVSNINHGDNLPITITPDTGYSISDVLVDGVSIGAVTDHTFTNITANHTIQASFSINSYTITPTAGANGSISPAVATAVDYGGNLLVDITPVGGYSVSDVLVDGASVGAVSTYEFTNVAADHTIHAEFTINTYSITASADPGGSITPNGVSDINHGSSLSITITPDTGYSISDVLVDGISVGAVPDHMFTNVTSNHTIQASFVINSYTITPTAGANGSISPAIATAVNYGGDLSVEITPAGGYSVSDVLVDGVSVGAVSTYNFTNVVADHTIHADFTINTYSITASADSGGSITPNGVSNINHGDSLPITITPDTGYSISDVLVDGLSVGAVANHTFTNITANHTIQASFVINTYIISPSAGANGAISPAVPTSVDHGGSLTVNIIPDSGYNIADVQVDGSSVGAVSTYNFTNITADYTIRATFSEVATSHTITTSAGANGSVSPSGATSVGIGTNLTVSIIPNTGYSVESILVDGSPVAVQTSYTFTNITGDHTLSASFVFTGGTITATAGVNGSISPAGDTTVNNGDNLSYTITPNVGYRVVDVEVDGLSQGALTDYTFTSISGNHTIHATFEIITYVITATSGANGLIDPAGDSVVNYGGNQSFTITPDANYHIADVLVNGVSVGAVASYSFTNVTSDQTISASFAINTHTITATAGENGSVSPSGVTTVNHGSSLTVNIAPNAGFSIADVLVDGASIGRVASYTFANITADQTITASFEVSGYTITATAGANGTITPPGATPISHGGNLSYTIAPETGYYIVDVLVDGVSAGAVSSYDFTNVTADHTISASFDINTYTITATAGVNGSVTPAGITTVNHGSSLTVNITPDTGYSVTDVIIDGAPVGIVTSHTFTDISADHTITASFDVSSYTITAGAVANGTISPSGVTPISHGGNLSYTIAPDTGYHITDVLVDGVSVGVVSNYDFLNVTADHTISASFEINTYTITANAGANGSVLPAGASIVNYGSSHTVDITPDSGYSIADVIVDGVSVGVVPDYTFTNITADHTIDAVFVINTYTIDAIAGSNGSVSPSGSTTVNYGDALTISILPDTGYYISDVVVDGTSIGSVDTYTFSNVDGDHTISASFSIITHMITTTANANGSITPNGAVSVNYGDSLTVSITPDTGFVVEDVTVNGVSVGAVDSYTFTNVISDHTITATFSVAVYTIDAVSGNGGSISPVGITFVNHGANLTLSITPDASYIVSDVLVDGVSAGAVTSYTFTNVTANHTIEAIFQFNGARITASAGVGGSVSPNGESIVNLGDTLTISITPDTGYIIGNIRLDGVNIGSFDSYTFSNIQKDHSLSVTFAFIGAKIVAYAGENGTISPNGRTNVNEGDNLSLTITPDTGYRVADVLVDGVSVGAVTNYTFTNITQDYRINARFEFSGATITASSGANGTITPTGATIVDSGDTLTYSIIPETGYSVDDVVVDGVSVGAVDSYTFSNINANHSISATFRFSGATVTATSGANGTISPAGVTMVNNGGSITYTMTPDAGYILSGVTVNGAPVVVTNNSYTITNITTDQTIDAQFGFSGATITATAGSNGTVSPIGVTNVNTGDTLTVNILPDAGFIISDVVVDGTSIGVVTSYTFSNITANHTLNATFEFSGFTITSSAAIGGSVSPAGPTVVSSGGSLQVSITPDSGYSISDVLVDGVSVGAVGSYTFTNVSADHSINAAFSFVGATITTSAGAGGTVSPDGAANVYIGDDLTITITPDATYRIADVLVDGVSVGAVTSYTFTNITVDHTLSAAFELIPLYTVSGRVTSSGTGIPDATITLSGNTEVTVVTDSSGNYSFSDIEQGVYTITPSITGYVFSPLNIDIEVIDQNLLNIDFIAMPPWTGIKQFGSSLDDDGWVCHEDIYGNVYVAGKTLGGVGGNTNAGGYDVYVKKYNASGVSQWTVQVGSTGSNPSDYVYGITTDSLNNVYVLGQTTGLMGASSLGGYDIFILKYNSDGQSLWINPVQTGTTEDDYARGIAADSDNNIYITGYTFGDFPLRLTGNGNAGSRDAYLMKYDSAGNHLWTDQQGTYMDEEGLGVAVAPSGYIYVTGYTEYTLAGTTHEGDRDIFLSKYDSAGVMQWIELLNSPEKEAGTSVTVSSSGDIYISGYTFGGIDGSNIGGADYLIAKYNSDGLNQWVRQGGSFENDMAMSISSFGADDIYIGGYTEGSLGTNSSAGEKDLFIVKFNSNGDEQWVRMAGTQFDDLGCALSSKAQDSVFISGYTEGQLDGGTNENMSDAFIIKLNSSGEIQGNLNVLETVDGNNDNIYDVAQDNVSSFQSYDDQDIITLETPDGTILSSTEATAVPQSATPPANIKFPYGVYTFNIENVVPGGSTTAKLYLPVGAAPTTYYKFGKTPADQTDHWYEFLYDPATGTGAEINGNEIILHFVDGLRGDDDLEANGVIVDPGAPGAIKTSTPEGGSETGGAESGGGSGGGGGGGGGGCFIGSLFNHQQ